MSDCEELELMMHNCEKVGTPHFPTHTLGHGGLSGHWRGLWRGIPPTHTIQHSTAFLQVPLVSCHLCT